MLQSYHKIPYTVLGSGYACDHCADCPKKSELSHEFLLNQVDNNKSSHSASRPVNNNICKHFWPLLCTLLKLWYRVFLQQLISFQLFKKFLVTEPTFITKTTTGPQPVTGHLIHSFTTCIYKIHLILYLHEYKQHTFLKFASPKTRM